MISSTGISIRYFFVDCVNDDDLILYGHRLILRLLQDLFDHVSPCCQTLLRIIVQIRTELGEGCQLTVLCQLYTDRDAAIFFIALICAAPPTRDTDKSCVDRRTERPH